MRKIEYVIKDIKKNLSIKEILKLLGFVICIYLILEGLSILNLAFIELKPNEIGVAKKDFLRALHLLYLGGVLIGIINSYWIHRKRNYQINYCIQQAVLDGIISPFLFMGLLNILLKSPLMNIILAKLKDPDSYIVVIPNFILFLFTMVALPLIKTKKIYSEDKMTENQIRSNKEKKRKRIKKEGEE
ncbi:hypothetical protein [Faecalicoccus pleomorphus]|uniref:hypothetical protein n=1 Tax=Faecalicoccus pleomorphus TaxID=1323 RepID=UPI0026F35950|nr:hypothetical protein [Faecalicoccus pleomorphus]